ncbi:putative Vacuolar (H+)-ATPase G subunit protein [Trachipleistophora hominis]|uniref:Putative Vacuolar (H+)-ATPase G subunit protein n=1 Tax=Trachipleistophora hominis TaxID=72359 RepID=L7JS33_TRAHO|nr:putative Vacuolar (H+)-ATPase G subunit protein [Trachipleistophora hominis]
MDVSFLIHQTFSVSNILFCSKTKNLHAHPIMASENVKKLVECERKAKEMVGRARNERADLLALSRIDADIAIAKLREENEQILEKERVKENEEVEKLIKELKEVRENDLREFGTEIIGCEKLVDDIVSMVSGTAIDK